MTKESCLLVLAGQLMLAPQQLSSHANAHGRIQMHLTSKSSPLPQFLLIGANDQARGLFLSLSLLFLRTLVPRLSLSLCGLDTRKL